jgi:hypothetical protein
LDGATVTDCTPLSAVIVIRALDFAPASAAAVAVIVAFPAAIAVTLPSVDTDALAASLVLQVTALFELSVATDAVSVTVSPTFRVALPGVTVTVVGFLTVTSSPQPASTPAKASALAMTNDRVSFCIPFPL